MGAPRKLHINLTHTAPLAPLAPWARNVLDELARELGRKPTLRELREACRAELMGEATVPGQIDVNGDIVEPRP